MTHPKVSLDTETLTFESDSNNLISIVTHLNTKLVPLGYTLSDKKIQTKIDTEILWTAVPIGLGLLLGFFILQKSGILSFGI